MNSVFVAWRAGGPDNGSWDPVGRLDHGPNGFRFVYTRGAKKLKGFGHLTGMPDLNAVYESDELFPLFKNRLLEESRSEYQNFLKWGGFDPDNPPDPLAILSVTEGLRQTDSLEVFPCPAPDAAGCFLTKFFLHGIRWMSSAAQEEILRLNPGQKLILMLEVGNEHDANAVSLRTDGLGQRLMIGYVPRCLAREVRALCQQCHPEFLEVAVERVNPNAPLQQRLLCRMSSCWPEGFEPCAGEEFQPIPAVATPKVKPVR